MTLKCRPPPPRFLPDIFPPCLPLKFFFPFALRLSLSYLPFSPSLLFCALLSLWANKPATDKEVFASHLVFAMNLQGSCHQATLLVSAPLPPPAIGDNHTGLADLAGWRLYRSQPSNTREAFWKHLWAPRASVEQV